MYRLGYLVGDGTTVGDLLEGNAGANKRYISDRMANTG